MLIVIGVIFFTIIIAAVTLNTYFTM